MIELPKIDFTLFDFWIWWHIGFATLAFIFLVWSVIAGGVFGIVINGFFLTLNFMLVRMYYQENRLRKWQREGKNPLAP